MSSDSPLDWVPKGESEREAKIVDDMEDLAREMLATAAERKIAIVGVVIMHAEGFATPLYKQNIKNFPAILRSVADDVEHQMFDGVKFFNNDGTDA